MCLSRRRCICAAISNIGTRRTRWQMEGVPMSVHFSTLGKSVTWGTLQLYYSIQIQLGLSGKLLFFITCQKNQGMDRAEGSELNDIKYNPLSYSPLALSFCHSSSHKHTITHFHRFSQPVVVWLDLKFTLTWFHLSIRCQKS